jgi:AraC-like DNA-binding protein
MSGGDRASARSKTLSEGMEDLDALTADATRRIRRGDLLGAHRSILDLAHLARSTAPSRLPALSLQLQSSLTLLRQAFAAAGFDVPPVAGDELASVLSGGATIAVLVDAFESRVHDFFNAATPQPYKVPSAQRIKAYIDANFHRPITVREIARRLRCSVAHIYDVFQPAFGVTPGEYLLDLRLERAAHLLTQRRSLPVADVWKRSGFGSYDAFHENFVARYGMTPSEYRRRNPS